MPERPDVGGFLLKHSADDLDGEGDSFETTNNSSFVYNGGAFTIGGIVFGDNGIIVNQTGEPFPATPVPYMVVYAGGQMYYWDPGTADWVLFSLDDAGPFIGAVGYDAGTTSFYYWDGTAWQALAITVAPADGTIRFFDGILEYYNAACDGWDNLEAALPTTDPGCGGLWLETP